MNGGGWIDYTAVRELRGPLLAVSGVDGVGWDEFVTIKLADDTVRHGQVLEVDRDLAVIQVLEGTAGMSTSGTRVQFSGQPLRIPVGDGWLGRVCNGRGEAIDDGPPVSGGQRARVSGDPLNPIYRDPPADPVLTGVSVIDALTTLVRGQKLPVFSLPGMPHLSLACQIAAQATAGGDPFCVVFAGIGLTHADATYARDILDERSAAGELVLLLNTADDPVIERMLTPRLALTIAEHLAFDGGRHVLVVMTDMTSYADAMREVSAARGEIPARRAYPGYLYSDLASLYERCGRIKGRPGSVTILPVLTMPGDGSGSGYAKAGTARLHDGERLGQHDRHPLPGLERQRPDQDREPGSTGPGDRRHGQRGDHGRCRPCELRDHRSHLHQPDRSVDRRRRQRRHRDDADERGKHVERVRQRLSGRCLHDPGLAVR